MSSPSSSKRTTSSRKSSAPKRSRKPLMISVSCQVESKPTPLSPSIFGRTISDTTADDKIEETVLEVVNTPPSSPSPLTIEEPLDVSDRTSGTVSPVSVKTTQTSGPLLHLPRNRKPDPAAPLPDCGLSSREKLNILKAIATIELEYDPLLQPDVKTPMGSDDEDDDVPKRAPQTRTRPERTSQDSFSAGRPLAVPSLTSDTSDGSSSSSDLVMVGISSSAARRILPALSGFTNIVRPPTYITPRDNPVNGFSPENASGFRQVVRDPYVGSVRTAETRFNGGDSWKRPGGVPDLGISGMNQDSSFGLPREVKPIGLDGSNGMDMLRDVQSAWAFSNNTDNGFRSPMPMTPQVFVPIVSPLHGMGFCTPDILRMCSSACPTPSPVFPPSSPESASSPSLPNLMPPPPPPPVSVGPSVTLDYRNPAFPTIKADGPCSCTYCDNFRRMMTTHIQMQYYQQITQPRGWFCSCGNMACQEMWRPAQPVFSPDQPGPSQDGGQNGRDAV